jgi:hypothetical protein
VGCLSNENPNLTNGKFQNFSIASADEETMVPNYNSLGTIKLEKVHQKGIRHFMSKLSEIIKFR